MWLQAQSRQRARHLQGPRLTAIVSGVDATAPGRVVSPVSSAPCPHPRSVRVSLSKERRMSCEANTMVAGEVVPPDPDLEIHHKSSFTT